MGQFRYLITEETGIHVRPAGILAKLVKDMGCRVTISKGDKTVDAANLIAVMGLGAGKGDELTIFAEDETALEKLKAFFAEYL